MSEPTPEPVFSEVVCPTCAHRAPFAGDVAKEIVICGECGCRMAFGVTQPRIVVEPDGAFIALRISGAAVRTKDGERVELAPLRLDRALAKQLGLNVLSIT